MKTLKHFLERFPREIASLHEAGNFLGTTTLVNLVLTSSASRYFRE